MAQGPKLEEQHPALQMVSSKIPGFVQSVLPCWQHCFPDTFPLAKFFDNFSFVTSCFKLPDFHFRKAGSEPVFGFSSIHLFLKLSS